jgi:hypothetical protein
LHEYEQALREAIQHEYPLSDYTRGELKDLQQVLSLRDENVAPIEMRVTAQLESAWSSLDLPPIEPAEVESGENIKDNQDSEPQVDYTRLRDLLAAGEWQEADRETETVMIKAAGRGQDGWLSEEDLEAFPCEDLRLIDELWVKYSNGHFGFSVQKRIWESVEETTQDADVEIWKKFGDKVGWRLNDSWVGYRNLTFSLDAPEGHLPEWVFVSGFVGGGFFGSGLFSRLKTCEE